jgi:hypothetical protein
MELLRSTVVQACSPPPPMGMGLSICRSIIEAHEGRLWVTADNGRGAIFHFTVPVDPAAHPSCADPIRVTVGRERLAVAFYAA